MKLRSITALVGGGPSAPVFCSCFVMAMALVACGDDDDAGSRDAGSTTPPPVSDAGTRTDGGSTSNVSSFRSILAGEFAPLRAYRGMPFRGRALLLRGSDGTTTVHVHATGLAPNTDHAAHVHAYPCAFDAGPHYKIDTTETEVVEENEIWPAFSTDADGRAVATVTAQHEARGDAMSVVIHDPENGNKMVCADLVPDDSGDVMATGDFEPFAAAEDDDQTIAGTATLVRTPMMGTRVTVMVSGLDPNAEYSSHVHALPCDENDAGGHYKIDPTEMRVVEQNELWPTIEDFADGVAEDMFESRRHRAREDAQSIVIHRRVASEAPKVACANLVRASWPDLETSGDSVLFDEARTRGYRDLRANASMKRLLDGTTETELSVTGAMADKEYPVHVHDLPCDVDSGGAHYKIDPSIADTEEENEIWLNFTADSSGEGRSNARVEHLARPEAQSIVIHDPEDAERLACIDLNSPRRTP